MAEPYYQDESVTLYHGDCTPLIPELKLKAELVVADPPYGETTLSWDRWPSQWPFVMTGVAKSMWVFGSMRMFIREWREFIGWQMSQDIVWEKHNGSGFAADRFKRVHEHVTHWYQDDWASVYHQVPTFQVDETPRSLRRTSKPTQTGQIGNGAYQYDGTRLQRSIIKARSMHGRAQHPTEKPTEILTPLIEYGCPPGGLVLDPFAGSGSTAAAAVMSGRRAVLIEVDEAYCEIAAKRLAQGVLEVQP